MRKLPGLEYSCFLSSDRSQKLSPGVESLVRDLFHKVTPPAWQQERREQMAKRPREEEEEEEEFSPADTGSPVASGITGTEKSSTSAKIVHLDVDKDSGEAFPNKAAMQCSLPPHKQILSFETYEEYEIHYHKVHVNRCLECRKNFPTDHFLNLHIFENHDALVAVKKERGDKTVPIPTMACRNSLHVFDVLS